MAKSPMEILRDLNLSLNNQNLEQAKGMLDEQRKANKPDPDRSRAALRTACLNVIRSLDGHDDKDLATMVEELRQQLGVEPSEVSTHSARYITHGGFTQFVPERKPSPKPW
jgi:hypothetical protein